MALAKSLPADSSRLLPSRLRDRRRGAHLRSWRTARRSRRPAIDRPLDLEQCVDATDGLSAEARSAPASRPRPSGARWPRYRRARRTAGAMRPAGRFQDWPRLALGSIELTVTAVGIGLEQSRPVGEMPLEGARRLGRVVVEHRRRRCRFRAKGDRREHRSNSARYRSRPWRARVRSCHRHAAARRRARALDAPVAAAPASPQPAPT